MLDVGIITWDEIILIFTASAHFPASYLAERLESLDALWTRAQEATGSNVDSKFACNALIGIWNIQEHYAYHLKVAGDLVTL